MEEKNPADAKRDNVLVKKLVFVNDDWRIENWKQLYIAIKNKSYHIDVSHHDEFDPSELGKFNALAVEKHGKDVLYKYVMWHVAMTQEDWDNGTIPLDAKSRKLLMTPSRWEIENNFTFR